MAISLNSIDVFRRREVDLVVIDDRRIEVFRVLAKLEDVRDVAVFVDQAEKVLIEQAEQRVVRERSLPNAAVLKVKIRGGRSRGRLLFGFDFRRRRRRGRITRLEPQTRSVEENDIVVLLGGHPLLPDFPAADHRAFEPVGAEEKRAAGRRSS